MPIEVSIPEDLAVITAALVVESNGGTRTVEVRVERPQAVPGIPDESPDSSANRPGLERSPRPGVRWSPNRRREPCRAPASPADRGVGPVLRRRRRGRGVPSAPGRGASCWPAIAAGLAAAFALERGEPRDAFPPAFAGAFAGVLASLVAGGRAAGRSNLSSDPARRRRPCRRPPLGGRSARGRTGLSAWREPFRNRHEGEQP